MMLVLYDHSSAQLSLPGLPHPNPILLVLSSGILLSVFSHIHSRSVALPVMADAGLPTCSYSTHTAAAATCLYYTHTHTAAAAYHDRLCYCCYYYCYCCYFCRYHSKLLHLLTSRPSQSGELAAQCRRALAQLHKGVGDSRCHLPWTIHYNLVRWPLAQLNYFATFLASPLTTFSILPLYNCLPSQFHSAFID